MLNENFHIVTRHIHIFHHAHACTLRHQHNNKIWAQYLWLSLHRPHKPTIHTQTQHDMYVFIKIYRRKLKHTHGLSTVPCCVYAGIQAPSRWTHRPTYIHKHSTTYAIYIIKIYIRKLKPYPWLIHKVLQRITCRVAYLRILEHHREEQPVNVTVLLHRALWNYKN